MTTLAAILPEHSEQLFAWRNDPEIYEWCRQTTLLDWANHEEWMNNLGRDKSIKMYLIKDMDDPVGVCGLTDINLIHRRAEFSLYIDPMQQGRGHGRSALIKLFAVGFREFGLNRIWGETFSENTARHLFESLGMEREGVRKDFYFKQGAFTDAILYSIGAVEYGDFRTRDQFDCIDCNAKAESPTLADILLRRRTENE